MRLATHWKDYTLLDIGDGFKIEKYGPITLKRPDPVATGSLNRPLPHLDAEFDTSWQQYTDHPQSWNINYDDLVFKVQPTSFKHTGLFPEQAVNWDWMRHILSQHQQPVRILNLFGYTGGATIACAKEACVEEVVHIDALKAMNMWTRENVALNDLEHKCIRTITDDVIKFLDREIKRGRTYQGIIMDPPSFGRGPKGERWRIESMLDSLLEKAGKLLASDALFMVVNTYTTNLEGDSVAQKVNQTLKLNGFLPTAQAEAIGIPVANNKQPLACGYTTRWSSNENLL